MTVTSHLLVNATSSLPSETRERNTPKQKRRKKRRSASLSISDSPPHLQIVSVPKAERVDPKRNSYILVIQPTGVRAAGGQWSADEVFKIAQATRGWDWSLNENGQPQCWQELEALLDSICKRSGQDLNGIEESKSVFRIEDAADSEQFCIQNTKEQASILNREGGEV